jgi:hypothetical protein
MSPREGGFSLLDIDMTQDEKLQLSYAAIIKSPLSIEACQKAGVPLNELDFVPFKLIEK